MEEPQPAEWRDWASGLPTVLLVNCFDALITCPTAHPSYFKLKAQYVSTIRRVCRSWAATLSDTPIGVCLPVQLSKPAIDFLCSITLRGIEFHDPERTHPSVVGVLSDPRLVAKSGKSLHNIIDAPYDGIWKPEDFPNISQLVVWRFGNASTSWDCRCIAKLPHLNYLVLAAGFKSLSHMDAWPISCKHLVWTSPSDSHNSRITVPSIPKHINLHWISVRAYAVRLQDPVSLLGRVQEITIHSAFIFCKVPQRFYRSLTTPPPAPGTDSSSSSGAAAAGAGWQGTAGHRGRAGRRQLLSDNWPEEGLSGFANMMVQEHTMKCLRLKFGRMLICHPLGLPQEEGSGAAAAQPPAGADDEGGRGGRRGRVFRSAAEPSGSGGDSESQSSDEEDLTYDEVTYDQVKHAFQVAIRSYSENVKARGPGAVVTLPATRPPPDLFSLNSCAACDEVLPPWIIPELECGKHKPGQERDLCVSRRYADPREPARLKLDDHEGPPHLTLTTQAPLLLASKRAVQAIAFAPWPFHATYMNALAAQIAQGGEGVGEGGEVVDMSGALDLAGDSSSNNSSTAGAAGTAAAGPSEASTSNTAAAIPADTPATEQGDTSGSGSGEGGEGGNAGEASTSAAPAPPTATPFECIAAAAAQQHALIRDPRFLESSSQSLRKLNNFLLGSTLDTKLATALLAPFNQLTKISIITPPNTTNIDTAIFPVSVVKVGLYASTPDQRFHAGMISNLTELWRLTLNGFYSFDLFDLPAVRPGFIIKVMDAPASRLEPLGKPGVDILMPRGKLVDVSVQLGTDKPVNEVDVPVTRVHLSQWSGLCRDMHIRCPPGVELYSGAKTVQEMFRQLCTSGLGQFTICLALDQIPQGQGMGLHAPVFTFVMASGVRFHGMSVVMLVRERMIPDWEVELVDAGMTGQELTGVYYITFAYTGTHQPA